MGVCTCRYEDTYHIYIARFHGQAQRRFLVKLFGVDDVRVRVCVKEYLDDVGVAQPDRIGKVRSHSESGLDFLVGVRARVYEDTRDVRILIRYREAERRLFVEVMFADCVQIFGA